MLLMVPIMMMVQCCLKPKPFAIRNTRGSRFFWLGCPKLRYLHPIDNAIGYAIGYAICYAIGYSIYGIGYAIGYHI